MGTSSIYIDISRYFIQFFFYLQGLARGSFLFVKLTLDLVERGSLVAKSASFKVLPVTLAQIYLLHFNLRFPTVSSFQTVSFFF